MSYKKISLLFFVGIFLCVSGCLAKGLTRRYEKPPQVNIPLEPPLYDFVGVLHIHSNHSKDSNASLEEIISAGKDSGCDFLIVTDHDSLGLKKEEGFHRGILLIVGIEISKRSGHFIGLNLNELPSQEKTPEILANISKNQGMSIVAHPCRKRSWTEGEEGFHGMEVFNLASAFQETNKANLFLHLLFVYPWNRSLAASRFIQRQDKELAWYDKISTNRHIVLLGSVDAHMPPLVGSFMNLYSHLFPMTRIHVLAPNLTVPEILQAMKQGRVYVGFDLLEDASSFLYYALLPEGKLAMMGEKIPFSSGIQLMASAPEDGLFILYQNGKPVAKGEGRNFQYIPQERGVYRLELYLKCGQVWTPWIYSNPVWLD